MTAVVGLTEVSASSLAVSTDVTPRVAPIERSKQPTDIGTTNARATSPVTALWLRMSVTVFAEPNVSGSRNQKMAMMSAQNVEGADVVEGPPTPPVSRLVPCLGLHGRLVHAAPTSVTWS